MQIPAADEPLRPGLARVLPSQLPADFLKIQSSLSLLDSVFVGHTGGELASAMY